MILLSYPSPVTEKIRDPWLRALQGCPFTSTDLAYARTGLTADIATAWSAVAAAHDARYLDLSRSLEGHEVCAAGATEQTEWAKGIFVNTARSATGWGRTWCRSRCTPMPPATPSSVGACGGSSPPTMPLRSASPIPTMAATSPP
ncbi:MAG: hypothetical protein R2755_04720 [Acidimicrobiales bacterium]